MIAQIIRQLQSDKWYNVSEEVEIAKGKNKIAKSIKDFKKQVRRVYHGKEIYN